MRVFEGTRLAKLNLTLLPRRQSDIDRDGYVPMAIALRCQSPVRIGGRGGISSSVITSAGWTNFFVYLCAVNYAEGCTQDCEFRSQVGSVPASARETEVVTLDVSSSFCLSLCYPLALKRRDGEIFEFYA